jgi:hypothetical protein
MGPESQFVSSQYLNRIIAGFGALFAEGLHSCIVLLFVLYPASVLPPKLDGKNANTRKLAEIKRKQY